MNTVDDRTNVRCNLSYKKWGLLMDKECCKWCGHLIALHNVRCGCGYMDIKDRICSCNYAGTAEIMSESVSMGWL